MKKLKIIIFLSIIIATVLGIYAQDISYFIDGNLMDISLIHSITIITVVSMLLYLATPILVYKHTKKQKTPKKNLSFYLWANSILGIPISAWSFFVMVMWWG